MQIVVKCIHLLCVHQLIAGTKIFCISAELLVILLLHPAGTICTLNQSWTNVIRSDLNQSWTNPEPIWLFWPGFFYYILSQSLCWLFTFWISSGLVQHSFMSVRTQSFRFPFTWNPVEWMMPAGQPTRSTQILMEVYDFFFFEILMHGYTGYEPPTHPNPNSVRILTGNPRIDPRD